MKKNNILIVILVLINLFLGITLYIQKHIRMPYVNYSHGYRWIGHSQKVGNLQVTVEETEYLKKISNFKIETNKNKIPFHLSDPREMSKIARVIWQDPDKNWTFKIIDTKTTITTPNGIFNKYKVVRMRILMDNERAF